MPSQEQVTHWRRPMPSSIWLPVWIGWISANLLGGLLVGMLEAAGLQFLATLVLSGPILGALQWLVLRRALRVGAGWVVASTAGWLAGTAVEMAVSPLLDPLIQALWQNLGLWEVFWLNFVNQLVILTVFGLVQWIILRRQVVGAGWWIAASALSGLFLGAITASFCALACQPITATLGSIVSTAATYGLGWGAYAVITGYMLVRILLTKLQPQKASSN